MPKNDTKLATPAIIALITLTLTPYTLQQVLNGCTPEKCTDCRKSVVPGSTDFRYCKQCKNSRLNIDIWGIKQNCTGRNTGIEWCFVSAFRTDIQAVGCIQCIYGFSLTVDTTAKTTKCTRTTNRCKIGEFDGAAEKCLGCENEQKLVLHEQCRLANTDLSSCAGNKVLAFKCEDGGEKILGCDIKFSRLNLATATTGSGFTEVCDWCLKDYALEGNTGKCIAQTKEMNKGCRHQTAFTDLCYECGWQREGGNTATNYIEGNVMKDETIYSYGNYVCGAEVLRLWLVGVAFWVGLASLAGVEV